MHRLFTAFVNHVPPQVLHLMVTAVAIVAREPPLSPRSSSILGHSANVVPHFRVIWNQEEEKKNDHGLNCGESACVVGWRVSFFHRIRFVSTRNYYRVRVRSSIDQMQIKCICMYIYIYVFLYIYIYIYIYNTYAQVMLARKRERQKGQRGKKFFDLPRTRVFFSFYFFLSSSHAHNDIFQHFIYIYFQVAYISSSYIFVRERVCRDKFHG